MSCIFCRIAAGEAPSRTVYEADDAVAFLDTNPLAPGHTLVVPRDHYETVGEMPAAVAGAVFAAVSEVAPRIKWAVDAPAATVAVHDGEAAGQEVPHTHVHVIPRFEGDDAGPVHRLFGSRPQLTQAELDEIANEIRRGHE